MSDASPRPRGEGLPSKSEADGIGNLRIGFDEPSWDCAEEQLALARVKRKLLPGLSEAPPKLDRYTLLGHLGAGAGGSVYAAFDAQLGREVAIKLLRSGRERDRRAEARLVREARALARLAHPNIVSVFDVGRYEDVQDSGGGGVFIVMELVRGATMRAWLEKPRHWREICEFVVQAARGMAAAHAAGLVHRDLKPSNLLVGDDGRLRVADFGVHVVARASALDEQPTSEIGMIVGTPRYMAPEQHRGAEVDARADQYALCVTAFEALVGCPPFEGKTLEALGSAKQGGVLCVPAHTKVPRCVLAVLERGLAADPQQRYPSMEALAAALLRCLRGSRRRWFALTGLAIGIMALMLAPTEDRACRESAGSQELFDADDRMRAARAFDVTGVPHAHAAWQGVERRMSELTQSWNDAHETACHAALPDSRAARLRCLDISRAELRAVVELLRAADAQTVTRAATLVNELSNPSHCLKARPSDATGVLAGAFDRTLQSTWARLRVTRLTGRYAEGQPIIPALLAATRLLATPSLYVETLILSGDTLAELGHFDEAEARLREAYWLGQEIGATDSAARAAVRLVAVIGGANPDEALTWARHAEALVERHDDVVFAGALWASVAEVFDTIDRLEDADNAVERALAFLEQAPPEEQRTRMAVVFNIRGNLAMQRSAFERAEADYARTLALFEEEVGPDHPDTAKARSNLARALANRGQLAKARQEQELALRTLEGALGREHDAVAIALHSLAQLELIDPANDDVVTQALDLMARAVEIVSRNHPREHPLHRGIYIEFAEALMLQDPDRAIAILDGVIEVIDAAEGPLAPALVEALQARGDAYERTSHAEHAKRDRERARLICADHPMPACSRP